MSPEKPLRALLWGTYDLDKPRTRILRAALRCAGFEIEEIHRDVWRGVSDKSQLGTRGLVLGVLRQWLALPGLRRRYARAAKHDVVIVGYLGHFDVWALASMARKRQVPLVWDAFLSLPDTLAGDRNLFSSRHALVRWLSAVESGSCVRADRVVLDTRAQAEFFRQTYDLPESRLASIWVGCEEEHFPYQPRKKPVKGREVRVLFYGQLIPLHGLKVILDAIELLSDRAFRFRILGRGQEQGLLRDRSPSIHETLEWIPWVPYETLQEHISWADFGLGIFGRSDKAGRVIPNKVFQMLASGLPLITRESDAIAELGPDPGLALVPADDPGALSRQLTRWAEDPPPPPSLELRKRFDLESLGEQWKTLLLEVVHDRT